MKTHVRIGVSVCCDYATQYWQAPASSHSCKKCGKLCETKGIDLQILERVGQGHYRTVDNTHLGFDKHIT